MNSYPHHLCRGNVQFTATEDGFFTVSRSDGPLQNMQFNSNDAFDIAKWLIEELKIQSTEPRPHVQPPFDVNYQQSLVFAVRELLNSLPKSRDWFNPDAERVFREYLSDALADGG